MPSFVRISNKVDTLGHACGIAIHEPEISITLCRSEVFN